MSHTVVLPALGESVTEGTVTRWLVEVGDTIEVDAPLVEVSTDKVDTEVPSPVAGVVEQILVPEDEDVEVGAALAIIGDGSGAAAPAAPAAAEAPAAPAAAPAVEAPAAAPVAAPKAAAGTYTVVPGDSLSLIAAKLGVAGGYQAIAAANTDIIYNVDLIFPGQVLTIPA